MRQVLHHLGMPPGWQTKTSMRRMSERRGARCVRRAVVEEALDELSEKTAELVSGREGVRGCFDR